MRRAEMRSGRLDVRPALDQDIGERLLAAIPLVALAALVVRYLENGRDLKDAMDWANKVGAIAVSKRGVVAVKREEVK